MTEYDYTKSPCAIDSLTQQIQQSAIVTSLAHCNLFGDALTIFFNADLSDGDKTILDGIVAAHDGVPLLQNVAAPVEITNTPVVTTQYELNNKDLKLARSHASVDDSKTATISMKVPGTFGSGPGRYIEGGYATTEDYDKDDYALVWVADDDRVLCAAMGLPTDGTGDATVQGMGVLPGALAPFGALPAYPVIKTYYDDDAPTDNQGWYFWPVSQGNSLNPVGETEVESIAGYAFCPSGLYLKIQYCRASSTTGGIRINFLWGRMG